MNKARYELTLDPEMVPSPAHCALIWAEAIEPPTETVVAPGYLSTLVETAQRRGEEYVPADSRARVRKMLRHGKYKPSGRGKPASEFLLRAALSGDFPLVNPPVDVNNAISLESGLPGSIFDAERSGRRLYVRRGYPGESYVFNPSGQTIDLQDLLLVCRWNENAWEPCGNPVKDAMVTKITASTTSVLAVLYAPTDESAASLQSWAQRYADMLSEQCAALRVGCTIVEGTTER